MKLIDNYTDYFYTVFIPLFSPHFGITVHTMLQREIEKKIGHTSQLSFSDENNYTTKY